MKSTAILCRTNAPLVECAFDLIKKGRGIRVRLIGKDIARELTDLVGEILDYRRNCPINEFQILLDAWIKGIQEKYAEKDQYEAYVAQCVDHHASLTAIAEQCQDARGVIGMINEFFVDAEEVDNDPATIVLSSGHRSKGLEWDRVIVLRPDLMPHPAAKTAADLAQEEHIKYVILTRAKDELILCQDGHPG